MTWSLVGTAGAVANSGTSPLTANAGQSSTPGNLLVCRVGVIGSNAAPTLPAGWVLRASALQNVSPVAGAYVFEYVENPGGIASVAVTWTPGAHAVAQVTEYHCPDITLLAQLNVAVAAGNDASGGTAAASVGSPFPITTAAELAGAAGQLAVSVVMSNFSPAAVASYSPGPGFTQVGNWNNGGSAVGHCAFDDMLDSGGWFDREFITDAVTISATGPGGQAGAIAVYLQTDERDDDHI